MRQNIYLLVSMLILVSAAWSQDPNYSQFYNNPTYYNPAMTAINNGMTYRINARNLWGPIPGRFNTFSAAGESQTIYRMGLGMNVYSDVAGEALLRTTGGYLSYSFRAVDTKNVIVQAGLGGGFISKSIDWSKLQFSDQLDETLGDIHNSAFKRPNYNRLSYADFNSGIVARFNGKARRDRGVVKKYSVTLGASIHHLSQPKDAFLTDQAFLPMRYVFHGNINMLIGRYVYSPGFIYEQQAEFQTFTIGMNFVNRPFTFGAWFRNRNGKMNFKDYDSFIFTMGVNLPRKGAINWRVMYSFDMTISKLRTSSYGSNELTLVIDLENRVLFEKMARAKSVKRKYMCPTDFRGYQ